MTKEKFRIIKEYDDHPPVVLGQIETTDFSEAVLYREWNRFQATHPDTDSSFIGWLVEEFPGHVTEVKDDFTDIVV